MYQQKKTNRLAICILLVLLSVSSQAETGYDLWLRYLPVKNPVLRNIYRSSISGFIVEENSPILLSAKEELVRGIEGLTGKKIQLQLSVQAGSIIAGTSSSALIQSLLSKDELAGAGLEGFIISTKKSGAKKITVLAANTEAGVLYAVFHFLRLLQTEQSISSLQIQSAPAVKLRLLNHWDNLDRTVERGYAGFSLWNWHTLPDYIDPRYIDYARANASVGINGTVLTNVNANAWIPTKDYLHKVAALASIYRRYGIKVYLTARFSAPIEIGKLKTADPLNEEVKNWWKLKAGEIYSLIPDFGGFLVKANSEGQPGPQNYGRSHADGANMLAEAVAPYNGIVMWRAFVYSNETPVDRSKQAYNKFKPLDGQFRKNVMIQVKNGPVDFQPREPFHPLFGGMPATPLMMEFQLTQEYLGQATNLVFLPTLFKEVLDADTYAKGKGTTVATIITDTTSHTLTGMAGVANIGNDFNWTGHPFAQANWYALGRLAWDHTLSASQIADEWIRQTFSNNTALITPVKRIMLSSHEILVNYMTPLGLHHLMGNGHHYGPSPWSDDLPRADWNPVYFHKADKAGIGFNRSVTGSNALEQYHTGAQQQWKDAATCNEKYLLWFHHVSWNQQLRSGKTLWNELCYRYNTGVDSVRWMRQQWKQLSSYIDNERFFQVSQLLAIQKKKQYGGEMPVCYTSKLSRNSQYLHHTKNQIRH